MSFADVYLNMQAAASSSTPVDADLVDRVPQIRPELWFPPQIDHASLAEKDITILQDDVHALLHPPAEVPNEETPLLVHPEMNRTSWKIYLLVAVGSVLIGGLVLIGYLIFLGIRKCMRPQAQADIPLAELIPRRVPDPIYDINRLNEVKTAIIERAGRLIDIARPSKQQIHELEALQHMLEEIAPILGDDNLQFDIGLIKGKLGEQVLIRFKERDAFLDHEAGEVLPLSSVIPNADALMNPPVVFIEEVEIPEYHPVSDVHAELQPLIDFSTKNPLINEKLTHFQQSYMGQGYSSRLDFHEFFSTNAGKFNPFGKGELSRFRLKAELVSELAVNAGSQTVQKKHRQGLYA